MSLWALLTATPRLPFFTPTPRCQVDELQAKEAAKLHHAHVLIFGEVRHGLGMHTLHLPPGHPERQAIIKKFDALKVGSAGSRRSRVVFCASYLQRPSSCSRLPALSSSRHHLCVAGLHALVVFAPSLCPVQESANHGQVLLISHYIFLLWMQRLRLNHSFFSAFFPSLDAAIEISRPQRLSILCLAILANMAFSAYFFGTNTNSIGQVRRFRASNNGMCECREASFPTLQSLPTSGS